MDDSQSSDLFSEASGDVHYSSTIEPEEYEVLVTKIKASASKCVGADNPMLKEHFLIILDDCRSCIHQTLNIIHSLLVNSNIEIDRLCGYLEDAVCILQILSSFIKNIIHSVIDTCITLKNFGPSTGNIILTVFTHCKDSECIYGNSLRMVEKQLKDLFRNCHELQLTYLMALEKYLILDLSEKEEQNSLIKTLEINLRIGDVVQSLDVKTMAEQWKAYTVICEKYSSFLLEKNIFNRTSKLLASSIQNNIKTALEVNEQDKMLLRSLKVANFTLKILLRICITFKGGANNAYDNIVKLLLQLSLCNSSYYELYAKKSAEFSLLMRTHLSMPLENLICTLVNEENFLKVIFQMKNEELKENNLLGYMLLLAMVMKAILEDTDAPSSDRNRGLLLKCVFSFLPYCHKWFNIRLCIFTQIEGKVQHHGLYEHILLHSVALTIKLGPKKYQESEIHLFNALLGTEYYTAIFASNLWVLLCRLNNKLHSETLLGLIHIYKKLETHASFAASPQRIHLSYTIEKLFQTSNEKLQVLKHINFKDVKNIGLWSVLKIRNLPDDVSKSIENNMRVSLFTGFKDNTDELDQFIKYLRLASTSSFVKKDTHIEEWLVKAWRRACPVCHNGVQRELSAESVWYFRYVEALAALTSCYMRHFERRCLVKILNIISNILLKRNIETVLLLISFFCKISNSLLEDQNDVTILTLTTFTIKNLLEDRDDDQETIFRIIASNDDNIKLIKSVVKDSNAKNIWNDFAEYKNKLSDFETWEKKLDLVADSMFIHKCIVKDNSNVLEIKKSDSNFDLGDIDSMFEESDGEEPASKKVKLDFDVENLIVRLENDVEQLSRIKANILSDEYKHRINSSCDKLKNIIS